jgi:hypothetical protein
MKVISGPCKDCGSGGVVPVRARPGEEQRPCPRCGARTAVAFLLLRIGSWTNARFDQHVRHEFGDEIADALHEWLEEVRVPIEALSERRLSESNASATPPIGESRKDGNGC